MKYKEQTRRPSPQHIGSSEDSYGIVAFSHLRWSFVWQRPQQFLSRFAHTHPVLFIEEPIFDLAEGEKARMEISEGSNNVTCAIAHMAPGLSEDEVSKTMRRLSEDAIASVNAFGWFDQPLLWFYSPMMAEWAIDLPSRGIVYDCMDELSQFKFAPSKLIENEKMLIEKSDVLFTGGKELLQKKGKKHPNAYFFGCGVDYSHFSKAQNGSLPVPHDVENLSKPIVGWFGVIDERVDYDLIAKAAALRPDYSFVLIGPVVKVDPASLPQAPNIHWLGGRSYEDLPHYCRAFDACMMCFAINEATEYINPTKALEYLATGKPVVSTPVREVVRQYSDLVEIAKTPEEFVKALDRGIQNPSLGTLRRGTIKAKQAGWDATVAQMQGLIRNAIQSNTHVAPVATAFAAQAEQA